MDTPPVGFRKLFSTPVGVRTAICSTYAALKKMFLAFMLLQKTIKHYCKRA
jgi:hypothetical protein